MRLPSLLPALVLTGCVNVASSAVGSAIPSGGSGVSTGSATPAESYDECVEGSVHSAGLFGGPLEGVDVGFELSTEGTEPLVRNLTRTDTAGKFHACIAKRELDFATYALLGGSQFHTRTGNLHLTFTKPGFVKTTRALALGVADARRVDVILAGD